MNHEQLNLETYVPIKSGDFELKQFNVLKTGKDLRIKGVFAVTDTEVSQMHGQRIGRTVVTTANFTASTSDFLIAITSLGVAPNIGLPDPRIVGVGKTFVVKDEVGGALTTNVTIRSDGERTVDGGASTTLATNYASKSFYADGSNWFTY